MMVMKIYSQRRVLKGYENSEKRVFELGVYPTLSGGLPYLNPRFTLPKLRNCSVLSNILLIQGFGTPFTLPE